MNGADVKHWRQKFGYSQNDLMMELGVRSRQTISGWENSTDDVPRMLELALIALAKFPECRKFCGKRATADEKRRMEKRFAG